MNIASNKKVYVYSTKPKNKALKAILFSLLIIILGIGVWVGVVAYNTIRKVTAFSGNNSLFSFLGDSRQSLKGEKEGRTNILLMGMGGKSHPGGTLSDTNIILSINWKTKQVSMLSVPRDLWVPIPGFGSAKLNEAHADGEKNAETTGGGGKLASETIENVLDIPIHYFVTIDFEGFKKIVDTVGGIDVVVDKDLYDPYYPAANMIDYDPFKITAGEHHMDGEMALKYARSRETTSDFDRSKRQQKVIAALKEKTLTLNILANPKKITDLLNIVGDHLRTNLSIGEIKSLWEAVKDLDMANIINKVLDTAESGPLTSSQDERGYYIYPKKGIKDFSDLQEIAKNIFSEETTASESVKGESLNKNLKIEILNGSGQIGKAKALKEILEDDGWKVSRIGDATKNYSTSVVYDCSAGKNLNSAGEIAKIIEAETMEKTACSGIDLQVVIGAENNL